MKSRVWLCLLPTYLVTNRASSSLQPKKIQIILSQFLFAILIYLVSGVDKAFLRVLGDFIPANKEAMKSNLPPEVYCILQISPGNEEMLKAMVDPDPPYCKE